MQIAATRETSPPTGAVGFCAGLYRTPKRFVLKFKSKCVYLFLFLGVSFIQGNRGNPGVAGPVGPPGQKVGGVENQ